MHKAQLWHVALWHITPSILHNLDTVISHLRDFQAAVVCSTKLSELSDNLVLCRNNRTHCAEARL